MLQIGITGGIGSGKSLSSKLFSLLGIPVYDADSRAKWLMNNDVALKNNIIENFGTSSYKNNLLDREFLAHHVFHDKKMVATLNGLVHPRVGEDYQYWVSEKKGSPYVLKEAALLFESGSFLSLDKIITVFAPKEVRINRTLARDAHRDLSQIMAIMDKQLEDKAKMEKSDFILYNDGSEMLIPQVLQIDKQLREG